MSLANEKTWGLNPHFKFSVGVLTTAIVVLTQEDARMKRGDDFNNYKHAIGFVVYEAEDGKPKRRLKKSDVVAMSVYKHDREVSLMCELEPVKTYYLVPSTFNAGEEGGYFISVNTPTPVTISGGHPMAHAEMFEGQPDMSSHDEVVEVQARPKHDVAGCPYSGMLKMYAKTTARHDKAEMEDAYHNHCIQVPCHS